MLEITDLAAPSLNELKGLTPAQLPHGVVAPPPRVLEIVAREEARLLREHQLAITAEARKRMLDRLTLQYYYENQYIAYRKTEQGPEVLAVGMEEIEELMKRAPEARADVIFAQG